MLYTSDMFKGNGSNLQKDKFARRDKVSRRQFCTDNFAQHRVTVLHGGSFLLESKIKKIKNKL